MTRKVCVIPARMGSSRFPGKPLAKILGLEMILHINDRCRLYDEFERVVVATCDQEILEAVENHGGEAVLTADKHERCTDRTEEAIANLSLNLGGDDLVLMVQGDEILVSPDMLCEMITVYGRGRGHSNVVNLVSRLYSEKDHDDPNTVKVVSAPDGRALYFSRAAIPSMARTHDVTIYQQTGIIGFSASFLLEFGRLEPTPLEIIESVDMLRVIEHGHQIQLVYTETETIGVDTPSDLARAERVLQSDPITKQYMQSP